MSLLIDTPRWPWRGHMWAHLISDESLDELHEAARTLKLRWLLFGRDHYDVPDVAWNQACELAEVVDSRDIVRSLRSSGLRVPGGKPKKAWKPVETLPEQYRSRPIETWLLDVAASAPQFQRDVLERPGECVVLHVANRRYQADLGGLLNPPITPSINGPSTTAQVIETLNGDYHSLELVLTER